MKKLLLLLSLFISVNTFADISRSTVFNFNDPSHLTPSITPASFAGGVISINNVVFANGLIEISFDRIDPSWVVGAQIFSYQDPDNLEFSYYLRVTNGTKIRVKALNGSTLNRITFSDLSIVGSLGLDPDSPNVGAQSNMGKVWDANGAVTSEVVFRDYVNLSEIHKMTVEYTEPSAVLTPVWTNYVNGGTIPAFESFNLRFRSPITLQSSSSIRVSHISQEKDNSSRQFLKKANFISEDSLEVTTSGDTLKIKLKSPITTDDTVKVTIDARAIRISDGYENAALSYTIPVRELRSTFVCESVDPAPGRVTEIPNPIKLKFSKPILLDEEKTEVIVFKGDEPFFATHLTKDADDEEEMTALISYSGHYTDNGVYRFVIKEGAVHTTFLGTSIEDQSDRWNPADTLVYEISDEPEPEPEPEPQPEDSETMKAAKQLLTISGVGYPADDAPARTELKNLTEAEEAPADDDIKAAIQAFYAETKVTLPTKDEWYQIVGVNSENESIYVTLEDEGTRASVSKDKAKAANFQAVAVDDEANTVVFATKDGKFLRVLSALPNYDKTSASNLTDEQSDVNKLVFDKFTAQSLNNEAITDSIMFGKFTMKGQLGKNQRTGTDDEAYACLNYTNQGSISTEAHNDNELFLFVVNNSHAFIIKPASEPTEDLITPVVSLEKDSIGTDTETLKLSFKNVDKVLLKDVSKAYFKLQEKDSVVATTAPKILTAIENSDNEFIVHVNGLQKNTYELVMPAGTFDFSKNDKGVEDKPLKVDFKIDSGSNNPLPAGVQTYYEFFWLEQVQRNNANIDYIADYELNDFTIVANKDTIIVVKAAESSSSGAVEIDTIHTDLGLYPIFTKTVRIAFYYTNETVATGHFELIGDMSAYGYEHFEGMKLVLDTPIEAGMLDGHEGQYSYVVEAGSFGNTNYGRYLQDASSVEISDCMLNKRFVLNVLVDNEKAKQRIDKIDNVNRGTHQTVVFDLQGRRHTGALKPGLYIIDGKKRVVK